MDLQPAIVVNKAQFPKAVHEEANPRAGCAELGVRPEGREETFLLRE
jgi:hypothetical protein